MLKIEKFTDVCITMGLHYTHYIIDRDGTHFRYILPKDEITRKELLAGAEFYQVERIIDTLTAKPLKNSVILSTEQRKTSVTWLKESRAITNDGDKLLYSASRDTASYFHCHCDNKGPTLTVIKSGNYTEKIWDGGYILPKEIAQRKFARG